MSITESPARKPWFRRWFGSRSERAAERYLRGKGYRIVNRNFFCRHGEIDLIALDGPTLVFVEVRSTGAEEALRPALSVNLAKQRRLTNLALFYLQIKGLLGRTARFDVVALSWPPSQRTPSIDHYVNAFDPVDRFQMYS